jgi:hypothetical protein
MPAFPPKMNQQQCDLLQAILEIKNSKQFKSVLKNLDEEKVEFLIECLINAEQLATSRKDKLLVKKYKRIFNFAKKVANIKAAKEFLRKNFPVLKKTIAAFIHSIVCGTIASAIVQKYG